MYPPAGGDFTELAELSFNGSDPRSIGFINSPANGLTALGYSATGETSVIPVMGDSARILLTINSYQLSDNNTRFGCYGVFSNNGSAVLILSSMFPLAPGEYIIHFPVPSNVFCISSILLFFSPIYFLVQLFYGDTLML